jgi:hypothetical protein
LTIQCAIVSSRGAGDLLGGEATVPSKPLLLLTDPTHFEVSYTINPWMCALCHKQTFDEAIWNNLSADVRNVVRSCVYLP